MNQSGALIGIPDGLTAFPDGYSARCYNARDTQAAGGYWRDQRVTTLHSQSGW